MSDYCEKVLAEAFAPSIRYYPTDDLSRESYWAARLMSDGKVRIFYAIAYYFDAGVISPEYSLCKLVGPVVECDPHNGDSEHIVLDIYFDSSTLHWVVDHIWYSKHTTYNEIPRKTNKPYPLITYLGAQGGYPLAWVSRNKHANYTSQSTCDAGGGVPDILLWMFPWDDCGGNNSVDRIDALGNRNLGSNSQRLLNCVNSGNYFYQDPPHPQECFWSASRFYGWQSDHSTSADGYGDKLRYFGF